MKVVTNDIKDLYRKVLIIDLSQFPLITSRIDTRDQRELNSDNSQFSKDLIRTWESTKDTGICTIIVNPTLVFTGLKVPPP